MYIYTNTYMLIIYSIHPGKSNTFHRFLPDLTLWTFALGRYLNQQDQFSLLSSWLSINLMICQAQNRMLERIRWNSGYHQIKLDFKKELLICFVRLYGNRFVYPKWPKPRCFLPTPIFSATWMDGWQCKGFKTPWICAVTVTLGMPAAATSVCSWLSTSICFFSNQRKWKPCQNLSHCPCPSLHSLHSKP